MSLKTSLRSPLGGMSGAPFGPVLPDGELPVHSVSGSVLLPDLSLERALLDSLLQVREAADDPGATATQKLQQYLPDLKHTGAHTPAQALSHMADAYQTFDPTLSPSEAMDKAAAHIKTALHSAGATDAEHAHYDHAIKHAQVVASHMNTLVPSAGAIQNEINMAPPPAVPKTAAGGANAGGAKKYAPAPPEPDATALGALGVPIHQDLSKKLASKIGIPTPGGGSTKPMGHFGIHHMAVNIADLMHNGPYGGPAPQGEDAEQAAIKAANALHDAASHSKLTPEQKLAVQHTAAALVAHAKKHGVLPSVNMLAAHVHALGSGATPAPTAAPGAHVAAPAGGAGPSSGAASKPDDQGGHWVTLHHNNGGGVHVFIDEDGTITKGPKALMNHHIGALSNAPGMAGGEYHAPGHTPAGATDHPDYTESGTSPHKSAEVAMAKALANAPDLQEAPAAAPAAPAPDPLPDLSAAEMSAATGSLATKLQPHLEAPNKPKGTIQAQYKFPQTFSHMVSAHLGGAGGNLVDAVHAANLGVVQGLLGGGVDLTPHEKAALSKTAEAAEKIAATGNFPSTAFIKDYLYKGGQLPPSKTAPPVAPPKPPVAPPKPPVAPPKPPAQTPEEQMLGKLNAHYGLGAKSLDDFVAQKAQQYVDGGAANDLHEAAQSMEHSAASLAKSFLFTPSQQQAYVDAAQKFLAGTAPTAAPPKAALTFGPDGLPQLPSTARKHQVGAGGKLHTALTAAGADLGEKLSYPFVSSVLLKLARGYHAKQMDPEDAAQRALEDYAKVADGAGLSPEERAVADAAAALLHHYVDVKGSLPGRDDFRYAMAGLPTAMDKFKGTPGAMLPVPGVPGAAAAPAAAPPVSKVPDFTATHPKHTELTISPHIQAGDQKFRQELLNHMRGIHIGEDPPPHLKLTPSEKVKYKHLEVDERAKFVVMKDLAPRIKAEGITEEEANKIVGKLSASHTYYGNTPYEKIASGLVGHWSIDSDGRDEVSVAMQILADRKFLSGQWDTEPEYLKQYPYTGTWAKAQKLVANPTFKKVGEAFLQSMHDNSQQFFKDRGVTHVVLFRGVHGMADHVPGVKEAVKQAAQQQGTHKYFAHGEGALPFNPLSSWSLNPSAAKSFASSGSVGDPSLLFAALVPVRDIIGSFATGYGCRRGGGGVKSLSGAEDEVVVKAPKGEAASHIHWVSGADSGELVKHLAKYTHT